MRNELGAEELAWRLNGYNTALLSPQVTLAVKNSPANAGDVRDVGPILGLER